MATNKPFSKAMLDLDCEACVEKITEGLRKSLASTLHRRGFIVAVSGGIDSSVTLALCAKAVGPERVIALQMPERHSAEETLDLSGLVAETFKVKTYHEDISPVLESVGFYTRYDQAVRTVIPEYGEGWKSKIVLPGISENKAYNLYSIVAQSPDGDMVKKRLKHDAYLAIVSVTNFKQRIRKMFEYYYADRFNYATTGTPNRLEYDQGFFVKLGDGSADIKPIAHLYKTQVYTLARHLGVPADIVKRPPTTDTYSLPQGQDEFYFALPYNTMDLCLYGKNHGYTPEDVAIVAGLTAEQVAYVYKDIDTKRATTTYLHLPPVLLGSVPEIVHA
ncbi:MAG: NAD(+) synthase [Proteobacteria bacterium]|nr:NAD(+) synthase [Pseudomonadota bacterium]